MSHAVTVTRTTTTTTTSAILINTGYFKTYPGIVKLLEMVIGIIVLGIVAHYFGSTLVSRSSEAFLIVTVVACLLGTTCIVLSSILSISTASILPKTLFEVTFHSSAFILYLAAGITYLINVTDTSYRRSNYEALLAAAILALINAALYLISTVLSYRSYKGK